MEFNDLTPIALLVIAFAFGLTLRNIDRRTKAVKNQIGRLSMTFLKIENDIDSLHRSVLYLASNDARLKEGIEKLHERRQVEFQRIVQRGTTAAEIMQGLEEPDIDEDPNYWSKDRNSLFGFQPDK